MAVGCCCKQVGIVDEVIYHIGFHGRLYCKEKAKLLRSRGYIEFEIERRSWRVTRINKMRKKFRRVGVEKDQRD